MVGAKELLRAVPREILDHVHELAPPVVPLPRKSLCILVREHGSGGFEDRTGDKVLRSDELKLIRLTVPLLANSIEDGGIGGAEVRIGVGHVIARSSEEGWKVQLRSMEKAS
jgi:hypothetical protein